MNEQDKSMEEFFKRSMEQFNDNPSDGVWDRLNETLEAEETMYTRSIKWLRAMLPFALLFLGLGAASLFAKQSFTEFSNNHERLTSENIELQQSISNLTNENNNLKTSNLELNLALASSEKNLESNLVRTQQYNLDLQKSNAELATIRNNQTIFQQKYKLAQGLNLNYEKQIKECKMEIEALVIGSKNLPQNTMNRKHLFLTTLSSDTQHGLQLVIEKNPLKLSEPINPKASNQINLENKNELNSRFRYRYGISARGYSTFIQQGNNLHISKSFGLRHELNFNENWSLSHALHFNEQEYSVDSASGILSESSLSKYPDNPGAYAQVRSVTARSKYLDTQLGIKYQWPGKNKNKLYFINPSVVWQLYLPQEFSYNLIQAQDLLVQRRSYIGYFGSVNLQVGIERSISEKMDFQLALFAERSFIELGHDHQILSLVGLRSSILFGK